jgi:CHASE3 domain sensor protein
MGLEAGEDQTVGPAGLKGGAKTAWVRGWAPRDELGRNRYDDRMESGGLGDLFGDPEELQRRLAEFAEQMQGNQKLAWADNAIKLAVDMTVAAVERINLQGNAEAQAEQIRTVMARVFPEAVALVREAREGLQ